MLKKNNIHTRGRLEVAQLRSFFCGGGGIFFSYYIQHCFICRPSDSTVPNPGPLHLVHWQPVALTTRLDLIRKAIQYIEYTSDSLE
jgi:hypothetical protein